MRKRYDEKLADAGRVLAKCGGIGASLALLIDGAPALVAGIGRRDPSRPAPPEPCDEFHLFSVAKLFIAAAVLRLVERGILALDAQVASLLSQPALPGSVTLRRVLNHTAGLPDYGGQRGYHDAVRAAPDQPWPRDTFLAATIGRHGIGPPGTFRYSNIGYLLARMVLERAAGQPLGAMLRAEVFAPAGAPTLRLATELGDVGGLAPGWGTSLGSGQAPVNVAQLYHPGWVAHGAVVGRALDAARALDGVLAGAVLSPASLAAMRDAVPVAGKHWLFQPPGYGLGLMCRDGGGADCRAGHGGEGPGYSTGAICLMPNTGPRVTAVALANTERHDLGLRLAWSLIESVDGAAA